MLLKLNKTILICMRLYIIAFQNLKIITESHHKNKTRLILVIMIKNDKLGLFLFGKTSIRIFLKLYNLFLLCPLISISPALGSCCSHHVNVRSMTHACQIIQSLFNIKTLPPTDPLQTNILSPSSSLCTCKSVKHTTRVKLWMSV